MKKNRTLRVVFWGTYDLGKPRVRLLLEGARSAGMEIIECHADLWEGIEDKSQISCLKNKLKKYLFWLSSYPSLIWRYIRLPRHDAVIVCYLGQVDVLVLKTFARLRGVPVIWDAFLSLYDTAVNDRRLIPQHSLRARLLYLLEWLSCRAADKIFLDTETHARYFEQFFRLPVGHVGRVFVGAETGVFPVLHEPDMENRKERSFTVLFYGQFIPLHGIDTIVKAARNVELSGEYVKWILIGKGQGSQRIDEMISDLRIETIERIPWVPYEELIQWIASADVCLGIFGTTAKASRVIPNKVFQILSAGRPLITADTPAIRELLSDSLHIQLIPPGDPQRLTEAVLEVKNRNSDSGFIMKRKTFTDKVIGPTDVGIQLFDLVAGSSLKGKKRIVMSKIQ